MLGYFIQHPQDTQVWLEVMSNNVDISYSWKVADTSIDAASGRRVLLCDDYSMPKRNNYRLRLELPSTAAASADGANYSAFMSSKWAPAQPLSCRAGGCSVATSQDTPSPRVVYKSNGGVFYERAGGDVWSESNADGGQLIFNWGVVRERESEILLQDASRAMWLQIKVRYCLLLRRLHATNNILFVVVLVCVRFSLHLLAMEHCVIEKNLFY